MKSSINKKLILLVSICCCICLFTYGQKTEINLNVYTAMFSFRGNGSTTSSSIGFNPYVSPDKYTLNPYGKKGSFSYSFELQAQRLTKKKNIYGLGISFETLTSRVNIDLIAQNGFVFDWYPAYGKTTLKNSFITLNPFAGHRYTAGKLSFDLSAGFDLAFCLRSHEIGKGTADDGKYSLSVDSHKRKPVVDFRPRVQVKAQYQKFGLLLGYSFGMTNYQIPGNPDLFTNVGRIGVSYAIR
jgi:hypothetical protein